MRPHHLTLSFSRVAIALTAALCLALPPAKAAPTQASTATARTSLVLPPEPQLALEEVRLEYVDSAGRPRGERDMRLVRRSERFEAGARVIELRFVDSVSGVSLTRAYRVSGTGGTPTVERTGALRNEGRAPISLLLFETLHLDLPAASGGWLAQLATPDYGYSHRMIGPGAPLVIQGPGAGQALEYIPGMVLTQPAGGGGLYAGVSWSTGFHFEVSTADSTHALLRVSESVDGLTLGSGEALNAPPVFLGAYEGTLADGTQALRHAVQSLQRSTRLTAPPVTWNSWFAYDRYVDEATLRAEAAVAASLGVEVFYVDHGWQRLNGDWRAHPDRFSDGSLRALSEYVHSLGMKFGVWMAFGVTDPRAPVAVAHPEWLADALVPPATAPIDGAQLLCLSDAKEWVLAEADRVVREYDVDWLKIDQAMIGACAPHGASSVWEEASRRANAQALYDVLDTLRARYPFLVIENCFNGGGNLDYGMYERTDVAWLTDSAGWSNSRPYELQASLAGATRAMPAAYLTLWLTEAHVHDAFPLEYWGISTMGGAWGLSLRLTELSDEDRREVGQLIGLYKRLRPYVAGGELDYVREPEADGWFALQYARPFGAGAALLAVRNGGSGAEALRLTELDAESRYRITCEGLSCGALNLPGYAGGASLMGAGLSLDLAAQHGVLLYFEKTLL